MKKMMTMLWNLWTSTEIKVGVLFSFLWLVLEHIVGGFDEQITALVILTSLDILTGFVGAFKTHSFMSSIATRGLFKKAAMILVVGLGVLLDAAMHTHMVRTMFIGGFAIIEALSIVENIDKMGYGQYIPEFLRRCLAQIATEKRVIKK
ncbi:holin, partial [Megasphaera sp. SW808]|uniref:phage holin family protein n=1 Tax=Megasphaera sp. SW808 TaxID=2530045 RepID=UPI00143BCBAE